ncbi:hypothetical protein HSBAA_46370 [Vreelandella sulfidaeris]|uniref:Uncharacterized protein n=1 Tax=Vreelandella sulfidaeris TaxID=115553 RepID=A0A455UF95_9GAMM|nr:hypothetical protein HSBAA_46370 [Halomonas sulfidaeris]
MHRLSHFSEIIKFNNKEVVMSATISRFNMPETLDDLPEDIRSAILAVQEKAGFVPNVF